MGRFGTNEYTLLLNAYEYFRMHIVVSNETCKLMCTYPLVLSGFQGRDIMHKSMDMVKSGDSMLCYYFGSMML